MLCALFRLFCLMSIVSFDLPSLKSKDHSVDSGVDQLPLLWLEFAWRFIPAVIVEFVGFLLHLSSSSSEAYRTYWSLFSWLPMFTCSQITHMEPVHVHHCLNLTIGVDGNLFWHFYCRLLLDSIEFAQVDFCDLGRMLVYLFVPPAYPRCSLWSLVVKSHSKDAYSRVEETRS